jgi:hypothetical protein
MGSPAGGDPVNELPFLQLACDPDFATFTHAELRRKLAAVSLAREPAATPGPAYRPGDRVFARTTTGEVAATVREVVADPGGWSLYVVEPDAGTPFPRLVVAGSCLSGLDEANTPHAVPAG